VWIDRFDFRASFIVIMLYISKICNDIFNAKSKEILRGINKKNVPKSVIIIIIIMNFSSSFKRNQIYIILF